MQHSIRSYRGAFFEVLRSQLADAGVELRLIHSNLPERFSAGPHNAFLPWAETSPAAGFELKNTSLLWQPVIRATWRSDLVIVEQAAHLLANYALLAGQRVGGPKVALWGHGRNFLLPEDSRRLSEAVKRYTSRRAHWWFAYNELAAQVVTSLGYPRERITIVDNATDTSWLAAQVADVTAERVTALRSELSLEGENVVGFIGTLGPVKRFDYLFAAADHVRREVPDFELVVAGSGTQEPEVVDWARRRPWAHYAGPRFGEDLVPLLAVAKLLLVPSWAGLVVVDSFAAGVPLVASAMLRHPPEIAYVVDGVNGRLVDDGGDPSRYAEAVVELLRDERRRQILVRGCVQARDRYSVESMSSRFTAGVLSALR